MYWNMSLQNHQIFCWQKFEAVSLILSECVGLLSSHLTFTVTSVSKMYCNLLAFWEDWGHNVSSTLNTNRKVQDNIFCTWQVCLKTVTNVPSNWYTTVCSNGMFWLTSKQLQAILKINIWVCLYSILYAYSLIA